MGLGFIWWITRTTNNGRAPSRGFSWHWTPQEWTYSEHFKDDSTRPDERTLTALGVEWQKPEMDALGNFCFVRGQVMKSDDAQKRLRPVTWSQGITVYLGMKPGAEPDWSKGMDQADSLHDTTVAGPDGRFEVRFDLRKTGYDRDRRQSFQFGVALAQHISGERIAWSSRAPALPSTVRMLSIPAAKALSSELLLVNRASGWPFSDPNGVHLIRAANALQPLGKERALVVLEQYIELTKGRGYVFDQDIVFWIIRVLFEPGRFGDPYRIGARIPSPMIAVFLDDRQLADEMKWPLNPMEISEDIPFMVGHQIGMGGMPEHPSSHIRWARLHGEIRDKPLVPTANPLAAAEAILKSRRFQALDEFSRSQGIASIRLQAMAMVGGLLEPIGPCEADHDDLWKARLEAAIQLDIHWDAKREMFATAERSGKVNSLR
jgi:hypothetical protein